MRVIHGAHLAEPAVKKKSPALNGNDRQLAGSSRKAGTLVHDFTFFVSLTTIYSLLPRDSGNATAESNFHPLGIS
jgi:hypothetical protein